MLAAFINETTAVEADSGACQRVHDENLTLPVHLYAGDIEEGHDWMRWPPSKPPSVDQMVETTPWFHAGLGMFSLTRAASV